VTELLARTLEASTAPFIKTLSS